MVVVHYLVFLVFRAVESVLVFVPLRVCWLLGILAGWCAYWLLPDYRVVVRRNLMIALGEDLGERECRRITRRHFRSLGRNFLCGLKVTLMSPNAVEKRVRYEGRQNALEVIEEGNGAIAAITHMGPWELLTQIPSFGPGVDKAAIYQPLANSFINRHILRSRAQTGVKLFDRRKGFYGPMNHVREGGGLGILVDQHAGDRGVWCPLFGRLASTTNLAALLSIRTGAPIVPIGLYPDGFCRWRVTYGEPIRPVDRAGQEVSSSRITAELNLAIEKLIRRAPEEWFWVHNRWRVPEPEFLLSAYRRGIELPAGMGVEELKPFRIVIRSPNWLGDACMAVPAVRAIKLGRPDAQVVVVCKQNLVELWNAVRHVDLVVPIRGGLLQAARSVSVVGPFDVGILLPNSLRAGLEMKLAGVKPLVGYRGHHRAWLVNQIVPERRTPGPPEHHAWRYVRIAHHAGADRTDPALYAPRDHEPAFEGQWVIGLCPGAAYGSAKRWPLENYSRFVERLHKELDGQVVWKVFGAPNEAWLARDFVENCAVSMVNLVGETTIAELMEELKTVHVLVTNDTGTMHLAALLGVKTVSIFGSTEPALTGPLGEQHRVLREHVECSPCFLRECPLDFRCMKRIETEDVTRATLEQLVHHPEASSSGEPAGSRLEAG